MQIKKQINLLIKIVDFNKRTQPRGSQEQQKEINLSKHINTLYDAKEVTLNAFKRRIFPLAPTESRGLKTSTPKQILWRL